MDCRSCEGRGRRVATLVDAPDPRRIWGADRISGLRCGRCGELLGAEDIAMLLLEKQSQLAQFGLLRSPTPGEPEMSAARPAGIRLVRLEKD